MRPMITLAVEKRAEGQKPSSLKKNGKMPAVFYGAKQKSTSVALSLKDFQKVWKQAGESSIVTLKDGGEDHDVLIQDVDVDPVTNIPRHADFYVIEKGKKLTVKIPLEFTGTSPAVKDLGGTLVKVMHELEIEALPKDLPHSISVDIVALIDFKSQIPAGNVALPPGVTLITGPEEVVAAIAEPKKEEEPEVSAPIDMSAIEVEKKGKEAKEGEIPEAEGTATTVAAKKAE